MQRLTLSQFAFTIALLLILAFGASQLLQQVLLNMTTETSKRMERAGRIYQ